MKTKAQYLFDSGVFQESKLEEDKAAIVAYYTDHGFVDAKIDNITRDVQTQQGRNYLILTVYLTEGEQWKYGGMNIHGQPVFTTARLNDLRLPEDAARSSASRRCRRISRGSGRCTTTTATSSTASRTARPGIPTTKTITYTLAIHGDGQGPHREHHLQGQHEDEGERPAPRASRSRKGTSSTGTRSSRATST